MAPGILKGKGKKEKKKNQQKLSVKPVKLLTF